MHGPPVVDEEVEDAQHDDEEDGGKLGLVPYSDHDAGGEADDRDEHPREAELAVEDESDEEEDEENAASELEVLLAFLVVDVERGDAGEEDLFGGERVGEDHQQAADDREVAEKEVEVEDESIAEALSEDDGEKAAGSVEGGALRDDQRRADEHGL